MSHSRCYVFCLTSPTFSAFWNLPAPHQGGFILPGNDRTASFLPLPVGQHLLQLQPFPSFCMSKSSLSNPSSSLPRSGLKSTGPIQHRVLRLSPRAVLFLGNCLLGAKIGSASCGKDALSADSLGSGRVKSNCDCEGQGLWHNLLTGARRHSTGWC